MRESGFNLGGEKSGHLVFLDFTTTGDGVVAALALLGVMVREQKPLSELAKIFSPIPQELLSVPIAKRVPLADLPTVKAVIEDVERSLGNEGRVLVRYSGTELLARVMIEGPDRDAIRQDAERIATALKKALQ